MSLPSLRVQQHSNTQARASAGVTALFPHDPPPRLFVEQWLSLLGMRPRQLILVLPAVGFWFRCDSKQPDVAFGACSVLTADRISYARPRGAWNRNSTII